MADVQVGIGGVGDLTDYVETRIVNCGTSNGLAEIAALLQAEVDYLGVGEGALQIAELQQAYNLLAGAVARYAGVAGDELAVLDAAIRRFLPLAQNASPTQTETS
jgi:hypothetical protein